MRHSILAFLFLALAMTAMSAPTKAKAKTGKPIPKCKHVISSLAAKKGGVGFTPAKAAPAKAAPAKAAPAKAKVAAPVKAASPKGATPAKGTVGKKGPKKRDLDSDSDLELVERASGEIQLCGMNFRGSGATMCLDRRGYFSDGAQYHWYSWSSFRQNIPAYVPDHYQCDHALELQVTVAALEGAGFCQAYQAMAQAYQVLQPYTNVRQTMKQYFDSHLKSVANDYSMLYFVDTKFNGEKGKFVRKHLTSSKKPTTTTALRGYFDAETLTAVNAVAAAIDTAASNLLDTFYNLATQGWDYEQIDGNSNEYAAWCALENAIFTTFRTGSVMAKWNALRANIGV